MERARLTDRFLAEAKKPEDWDDEEDGDWEPPMVPNPKCAEASGCGPWERPMIVSSSFSESSSYR